MSEPRNPFENADEDIFEEEEEILGILEEAGVDEKDADEIIELVHKALEKAYGE
ncbi:MAG: hypothetical protein KGJ13_10055 [Patescibacteria group bacterium]|nr:hypothetical protein [Patescibacteria group bacterium]